MMRKFIFILFLIVGIAVSFWGYTMFKQARESKNWPTTNGKVTFSEVKSSLRRSTDSRKPSTTMYSAEVLYEYTVNGSIYTSKKVSLGDYTG